MQEDPSLPFLPFNFSIMYSPFLSVDTWFCSCDETTACRKILEKVKLQGYQVCSKTILCITFNSLVYSISCVRCNRMIQECMHLLSYIKKYFLWWFSSAYTAFTKLRLWYFLKSLHDLGVLLIPIKPVLVEICMFSAAFMPLPFSLNK